MRAVAVELVGHSDSVFAVAVTPDGRRVGCLPAATVPVRMGEWAASRQVAELDADGGYWAQERLEQAAPAAPSAPGCCWYRREAAARYAFLLAIPAVLAAGLLELSKIGHGVTPARGPTIFATAIHGRL